LAGLLRFSAARPDFRRVSAQNSAADRQTSPDFADFRPRGLKKTAAQTKKGGQNSKKPQKMCQPNKKAPV
jgi:hypothetical protein